MYCNVLQAEVSNGCITACLNKGECAMQADPNYKPWDNSNYAPLDNEKPTLDLESCRVVARAAADIYRIVHYLHPALSGAEHLKKVAMDRCVDIMNMCEKVTGVMDGRPDK